MSIKRDKPRVGVLIINLGTPDAPEPGPVRRYLKQFLSDRRVVELPPLLWQPILRGIVLMTRPRKSAHAYSQVWRPDGSPLAAFTRAQAVALRKAFQGAVQIDYAMRYGNPDIAGRIDALVASGCDRILLAPLYPQYCAATTATANDAAFAKLATMRCQPAVRTLPSYHDDPDYIAALKTSIEQSLASLNFVPDALIASYHGMPERTRELGDPYYRHCVETTERLSTALGRPMTISFQSRFGRAKWLEPATDAVLHDLPSKGIRKVAIVAPGFSVDCVETLEELSIRGRETFMTAGGQEFAYLPCLNDTSTSIAMVQKLIARELEGWLSPA